MNMSKVQAKKKRKKTRLLILLALLFVITRACIWYVNDYYHVTDKDKALASTEKVQVSETDFGYAIDGPGENTALIFYPGAKVEDLAYADLLKIIAESGMDCFLVHMPCNLAFFGISKADEVMEMYDYKEWYLAGHSLGGAMAAGYAEKHANELMGLILLAFYSTKDLSDTSLEILSIFGSEDQVVNRDKIVSGRSLMPKYYEEYMIEGGNHAGFGDYGEQAGDGEPLISGEEQKKITADKFKNRFEKCAKTYPY